MGVLTGAIGLVLVRSQNKTPETGKRFNKNFSRRTRLEVVPPLRQP
jgi:hypothetical protein